MTSKCKTCGNPKGEHPIWDSNSDDGVYMKCLKFQPEDEYDYISENIKKMKQKKGCPYCKEPENSEKGCEECSVFNFEQQKGCGKIVSGEYKHGGYWEMPCGDLGRRCPSCSNQSSQTAEKDIVGSSPSFGNKPDGSDSDLQTGSVPIPGTQNPQVKISKKFLFQPEGTFNLSDKIWIEKLLNETDDKTACFFLNVKDVKEFIRRLKEELFDEAIKRKKPLTDSSLDRLPLNYINRNIDKLAGEKLI